MIRIATIGALAALAISAPVASADNQRIRTKGGVVTFTDAGRPSADNRVSIAAKDKRRDGSAVRAYLQWTDPQGVHTASVTDPRSSGKGVAKDLTILSGTPVLLSMCYIDNGRVKQCSFSQRAEA